MKNLWKELDLIKSKGSQSSKVNNMGELHNKRKETLSQYFTPEWLSNYISKSIAPAFHKNETYTIFDSSVGAGSLLRNHISDQFFIYGVDTDESLVNQVNAIFDKYDVSADIQHAGMEHIELKRFSCAVINPPFSIPLSSPLLTKYKGITHFGKYGADTSAVSHEYALAQALAHSDIVAAIVPASTKTLFLDDDKYKNRVKAICKLPTSTFASENVDTVNTDLLIFGPKNHNISCINNTVITETSITKNSKPLTLDICCRTKYELNGSQNLISILGVDTSKPVIVTPISNNNQVILRRAGRHIKLCFFDGATEAKVKNKIYQHKIVHAQEHRYPKTTKYIGQFKLNLDVISMQRNPMESLNELAEIIQSAGGYPIITEQLKTGLRNIIKENKKMLIPYGRTVYRKGVPEFKATARKMSLINKTQKGAVVGMKETVMATRNELGFSVKTKRGTFNCIHDHFFNIFDPEDKAMDEGYWENVEDPISQSYPNEINAIKKEAIKLGIDQWLSWDYQIEDLCELAFRPKGGICAWQMALGKTRLIIALCLLLKGKSLIILKSRLIDEMVIELNKIGIQDFNIINTHEDINYKKINIISYERLKRPVFQSYKKITWAKTLRNKFENVIADEGGLLSNINSQQTKAVWKVGGKKHYIMDGSPGANYPREFLELAAWTVGEERIYQPFSIKNGYLSSELFETAKNQHTGKNAFFSKFVTMEWATNEFIEDGRGAKREIPKIPDENIGEFREWLSPIVKRRVQQEPAVKKHVEFKAPIFEKPQLIEWDYDHLVIYIKAVEDFANWYKRQHEYSLKNNKKLNLTLILARLEACFKACNIPSTVSGFARPYNKLTSKERATIDWISNEISNGNRPIVFARSPAMLKRISKELNALKIRNLVFTGEETIKTRMKSLNERIRDGSDQVLLASLGVTNDGLNLPQLNSFLFVTPSFKVREEIQGVYRLIRPQQTKQVKGTSLHLRGSIDEYISQLNNFKLTANSAGLDFGENAYADEFVHFDAFFQKFINTLPELKEKLNQSKMAA